MSIKVRNFKINPGDEVLVDGYIKAVVKRINYSKKEATVTVKSNYYFEKDLYWTLSLDRCLPNTIAAKILYLK